ncbi:alkaline phosphatase family protein [Alteromonas ponticola]|uniref:Alkaline phosphatase family protein n=1 Tax=Alteromonas aquimaris TaxID=2998417 RepID=A0ABT3PA32_9ALTE|nr:alkaline phosphatase family protein [Alteromonas aquimaris]MCW8109646.1 alkaline phosphatase family protein [Alteromonas aquimaris]
MENNISELKALPIVIAGPILRRLDADRMVVWAISSQPDEIALNLSHAKGVVSIAKQNNRSVKIGDHAYVWLLEAKVASPFAAGEVYYYDLTFCNKDTTEIWAKEKQPLLYSPETQFSFRYQNKLTNILHGSCRKPHFEGEDALLQADKLVEQERIDGTSRPDLLLFTGDQVYADDVAGPTLQAIQQIIQRLKLFDEALEGAAITHSSELPGHEHNFYQRQQILPQIATNSTLSKLFFGAAKKPVFTSVNAQNHLISFAEVMAMYILCWSDAMWEHTQFDASEIKEEFRSRFREEEPIVTAFSQGTKNVRRVMAHIPTLMIFDDHDVTDDWNLTRGWEEEVYNHPFSRRMVGNALMAYWLCQGWGNAPEKFNHIESFAKNVFSQNQLNQHDEFISLLYEHEHWHFALDTQPPLYVMDTRTRRWRSESSNLKPSGLMDWEALCEFQQAIIGQPSVIVVSAAPIYGVKAIEAIQKIFTQFGKALTVDAENWMAHKGTANVILNVFRHVKTPPEFIILSGDVHYSFVYDVRLRFRRNSPHITQFTCSGLKNSFPAGLLRNLDRLNRWLYGPDSPLNLLTRRRNMSVSACKPFLNNAQTLVNKPALGQLLLTHEHRVKQCKVLCNDGEKVEFSITPDNPNEEKLK